MKKLGIAVIMLLPAFAFAPNYILDWTSVTNATGYKIYSSTNELGAANMNWKFERATQFNTGVLLTNIPSSVLTFAVSATNFNAESAKTAQEILQPPLNLKIVAQ